MPIYEIKHWQTGAILASKDMQSIKAALESCVAEHMNLDGADLDGASLRRADLDGANLDGADLDGADLDGAHLGDLGTFTGRGMLQIGPIGSRDDWLIAYYLDTGIFISTGCFQQRSLADFAAAVQETHGDNVHAHHYAAAIALINACAPDNSK